MNRGSKRQVIIGATVLGMLVMAGIAVFAGVDSSAERLGRYLFASPRKVSILFSSWHPLQVGDPIYEDLGIRLQQVGVVTVVRRQTDGTEVEALLFSDIERMGGRQLTFTLYGPDQTVNWVLKTLLTPRRREAIQHELQAFWAAARPRTLTKIKPILTELVRRLAGEAAAGLVTALKMHRPELEPLLSAHREALERKLLPLLRSRLLPHLMKAVSPLFSTISGQLIDRFPATTAGWSYVKDKLPWGRRDNLKELMKAFFQQEVWPTVQKHQKEFVAIGQHLVLTALGDPEIVGTLKEAGINLLDDDQLQRIVRGAVIQGTLKNQRIRALLKEALADPELQSHGIWLAKRFEPTLKRITRVLLLDPGGERLDSKLALLLRARLMGKDQFWIRVTTGQAVADSPPTQYGGELYGTEP